MNTDYVTVRGSILDILEFKFLTNSCSYNEFFDLWFLLLLLPCLCWIFITQIKVKWLC